MNVKDEHVSLYDDDDDDDNDDSDRVSQSDGSECIDTKGPKPASMTQSQPSNSSLSGRSLRSKRSRSIIQTRSQRKQKYSRVAVADEILPTSIRTNPGLDIMGEHKKCVDEESASTVVETSEVGSLSSMPFRSQEYNDDLLDRLL